MGLEILLVEDSWVVGEAVKDLLELLGRTFHLAKRITA